MRHLPGVGKPKRREAERERGQILVLFELSLIVILLFCALVIDLGMLRNNRQILVNAMDAGALAGGTLLPVDNNVPGHTVGDVEGLVAQTVDATYTSSPSANYVISYRCLIGADPVTGTPLVNRDVPMVCNPTHALGHTPNANDFIGAGPTRNAPCDPRAGDRCNVIVLTGIAQTDFSIAPVVGINQGSTGAVVAAACKGPCGAPPVVPVDLVIILDRTLSMAGSSGGMNKITALQNAAKAVLSVYDPSKQRVALALTGPSAVNAAGAPVSSGCGFGAGDNDNWSPLTSLTASVTNTATTIKVDKAKYVGFPGVPFPITINTEQMLVTAISGSSSPFTWTVTRNYNGTAAAAHNNGTAVYGATPWAVNGTNVGMWVPVGLSGTDGDSPAPYPNGAAGTYSSGGVVNASSTIAKAINCISAYSDGTDLSTPIKMAQWYLDHYGRKGVTQGIILETDGHPQYGFDSTNAQPGTNSAFTCQAALDAANAAKADKTKSPDGIQFFTIGYGVDSSVRCPRSTTRLNDNNGTYNRYESSAWSNGLATDLLKSMATDAQHYFENPSSSQLASVFTQAATQLTHGGSHLIQLYPAPIVTGVGSGTTVTISGKYFTGAVSVYFGAVPVSFTVNGDSSITAQAPAGNSGSVVDVTVTTPGGSSAVTPADRYTFP